MPSKPSAASSDTDQHLLIRCRDTDRSDEQILVLQRRDSAVAHGYRLGCGSLPCQAIRCHCPGGRGAGQLRSPQQGDRGAGRTGRRSGHASCGSVCVAELVAIRISEVAVDACRIRITSGKGGKDRYVPFPASFKETFAPHIGASQHKAATFLFESSWKKPYSTRGVRAMLACYAAKAGLAHNMAPHHL